MKRRTLFLILTAALLLIFSILFFFAPNDTGRLAVQLKSILAGQTCKTLEVPPAPGGDGKFSLVTICN